MRPVVSAHFKRTLTASCTALLLALPHQVSAYQPEKGSFSQNRALYHYSVDSHLDAVLSQLTHDGESVQDELLTVHALLNYGLYNAAEKRFLQLLEDQSLNREERGELYLSLARYAFERGYDDAAQSTLAAMEADLGNFRFYDRKILSAFIAGRRGELDQSIAHLENRRVSGRSNYGKYNLAMAYFAAGDDRSARAKLDQIGQELVNDPIEHALRDRANLTLAYDYLRVANGTAALPVLQRIRLDGPYSHDALLALGWAELSAEAASAVRLIEGETQDTIGGVLGQILRPGRMDQELRRRLGMMRAKKADRDSTLRYRRAIHAWQELAQRDVRRTAVLEVEVALPWALTQLGEFEAARRYYKVGIQRLDVAKKRIDSAVEAVKSGRMFETLVRNKPEQYSGWRWRPSELADADETWYLSETLAKTEFQEALKNYRDLRQLERRIMRERTDLERSNQAILAPANDRAVITRERAQYKAPLFPGLSPQLGIATKLGQFPRNETLEGLLQWTYRFNPKYELTLTNGLSMSPGEVNAAARPLLVESEALLADIQLALPAQRQLLEDIALRDLSVQQEAIRKYQIEARFSLARLYDAQRPTDTDTSEEE